MRKQPLAAWNKGRLLGQKPPLKPKEIWSLRIGLQLADKARDLALFNLAIDSKPTGKRLSQLVQRQWHRDRGVSDDPDRVARIAGICDDDWTAAD
jgi:hypothetical protein